MKYLLALILLATLGCDDAPPPTPYYNKNGWVMVDSGPEASENGFYAIYKKRLESERVTMYATKVHYGWSITAVKD